MPHSHNIDNEVNAPSQMRDVIIWGCAAMIATTAAISSYVSQSEYDFTNYASLDVGNDSVDAANTELTGTSEHADEDTDNITTGSIRPKNSEQLRSSSASGNSSSSFGTTIARRQSNADSIRRMNDEQNSNSLPGQSIVRTKDAKITDGPIGIDLGTGYSFSVLGRRFSALVNAAPTLFNDLSPRAAIVEDETSIKAHLVVGPLKDIEAAKLLCNKIQLRVNTTCQPTNFSGRKLKLY